MVSKNPFERPVQRANEKPVAPKEQPSYYDPEEDPLKGEVDGLLAARKYRNIARVYDPKTKTFQKSHSDEYPEEEVWRIPFPNGLGHPQDGHFAVSANVLNKDGRPIGGGWVESFENEYDAQRCAYILNRMDSSYEARVASNKGW